ncbi:MAG: hypothetical protein ABR577_15460 [Pyrinomonadaceae bacterium]
MKNGSTSHPLHENLDTAYVNVAALLRYLQGRKFAGRVHVELDEYEADIFLNAEDAPHVRETDHAAGRTGEGEAALQRLLVRATEAGGLVSIYAEVAEDQASRDAAHPDAGRESHLSAATKPSGNDGDARNPDAAERNSAAGALPADGLAWDELARVSGELIAAVERAVAAASGGADFLKHFREARLALADDYSFLDPSTGRLEYRTGGALQLRAGKPDAKVYATGVSECLRRVVEKVATQARDRDALRERVALELAVLARRRQSALARAQFTAQLDRIAGTRVL